MWLLNNMSSFVKNVIILKHNTSAFDKTCPSVVLYCFLKYLRECQFFKEIVIFQKSDPFFVLFQTTRTLLILTLHWKAMLFWKCLYPYFNFKWLFDVATEVKILLWHTYYMLPIIYCQYHAYWCPVNLRSHGVSRYGIDQIRQNIPSPVWGELIQLLSSMYNSSIISTTLDYDFKNTNQTSSLYIAAGANWKPFCRRCLVFFFFFFQIYFVVCKLLCVDSICSKGNSEMSS